MVGLVGLLCGEDERRRARDEATRFGAERQRRREGREADACKLSYLLRCQLASAKGGNVMPNFDSNPSSSQSASSRKGARRPIAFNKATREECT